jgi:hypothetical protein
MSRAILPKDADTWRSLLGEHGTITAVARAYGTTQQAASAACKKALGNDRQAGRQTSYKDHGVPWTVQGRHADNPLYRRQLLKAGRNTGRELSPAEERELAEYLDFLEEGPYSIAYWPETRDGFYAVPRRPEDVDAVRLD